MTPFDRMARHAATLARQAVGAAALQRRVVGGPLVQALGPGVEVGMRGALAEGAGELADEAHLDVGAGELVAEEIAAARERAVDIAQVIGDLALDARLERRTGLAETRDIEVEQQRQQ